MRFPELKSNRVDLIHLNLAYLEHMFEYSRLGIFYDHLEFPKHTTIEETKGYLENLIIRSNENDAKWWFIWHRNDKRAIGTIGLSEIDSRKCCAEVSYGLSPTYWKQGYFSEALSTLLKFSKDQLLTVRTTATTSVNNKASISGLHRHGFVTEGVLKNYYRKHSGEFFDAVVLAKIDDLPGQ